MDIEEEHLEPNKLQIKDDFQIAQALQASLDNVVQGSPEEFSEKATAQKISDFQ